MREDWEWESAEEEGIRRLYEELAPQAVEQFTTECLTSYYIQHPELAYPAYLALSYAHTLETTFPRAALVFAFSAIEITTKDVLLKPIVFGLIHNQSLADFIAKLSTTHTGGIAPFVGLLSGIFYQFVGIDLKTFKRDGSITPLLKELDTLHGARNKIVHCGETKHDALAPLAIDVASTLLNVLFPKLLQRLGLHLHDPITICAQTHLSVALSSERARQ